MVRAAALAERRADLLPPPQGEADLALPPPPSLNDRRPSSGKKSGSGKGSKGGKGNNAVNASALAAAAATPLPGAGGARGPDLKSLIRDQQKASNKKTCATR